MTMIGVYGAWFSELVGDDVLPRLSFRRDEWTDVETWRETARRQVFEYLAIPDMDDVSDVTVHNQYVYDGLHVEEISWQLPFGPPTQAIVLKPTDRQGKLPAILALHDHATNKYFGKRKIARTSDIWHPSLFETHAPYYGGVAWANEVAKQGYVALIHDGFSFGSRRIMLKDVPEKLRGGLIDTTLEDEPHNSNRILAYNRWAADHEHIIAKSLFAAGTTWAGVFLAEDRVALDILCAREDVDEQRVGCGGLSGGGLRVVFLAGMDERIKCAICVGQMTTYRDFSRNLSDIHSWMNYSPLLPRDLDYPEILGLRVPLPTMVLVSNEDPLFTLSEMQRADAILHQVFEKAGATEKYRSGFYSGGHKFDLDMQAEAFAWFDNWLQ